MDKKRVVYYDFARVFAIISISFNHAVNRTFDNYTDTQLEYETQEWSLTLIKTCVTVFSRIGVPVFLMLTGALILSKQFETRDDVKHFFLHNWLRLLIAVEIWLANYFWFIYYQSPDTILSGMSRKELIIQFVSTLLFVNQTTEGLMWYMNMLIPLYTLLPVLAVFVNKGYLRYLSFPAFFTLFVVVFVYDISRILALTDYEIEIMTILYPPLTYFAVYVIVGFALSRGVLAKVPGFLIFIIAVASYALAVRYQLWFYKGPSNDLVSYDSIPLMLCSMATFDLFRRADGRIMYFFRGILSHISRRCLGIYFVHIVVMEMLNWNWDFTGWDPVNKMLFLEGVSLAGGLLIVEILGIIKPIRKYVLLVK